MSPHEQPREELTRAEANERRTSAQVDAVVEVDIERLAQGGAGVARLPDGRVVFVPRSAPGDRLRIRIVREKSRWAKGVLVEVLEKGPDRVRPPCPLFKRCGGCSLQHLEYGAQLAAKAGFIQDALTRIGGIDLATPPEVMGSPEELRYRSRMSFHLRRLEGSRVAAGLHEVGNPGLILEVDDRCLLPELALVTAWQELRDAWGPGARRLPTAPRLRLTLRTVTDGAVLIVERKRAGGPEGRPLELLSGAPSLRAVWLKEGDRAARLLAGEGEAAVQRDGRRLRLAEGPFLQANAAAARAVREAALQAVGRVDGLRILDAYCGVGELGRRLATRGASVVGIESDPAAVDAAREDAPETFSVVQGKVEERLDEGLPADIAILNPPRSGLHGSIPPRLLTSVARSIVYISCDPATLARDLAHLSSDFDVATVQGFDLFPQTARVETLVTMVAR